MKKIKIIALLAIGTIIVSCQSNTYEEVSTVKNPTYSANISALMSSKCTSCHSATGSHPATLLDNYTDVKAATELGDLLCLIDNPTACFYSASTIMPPTGKMPQSTIDMVKRWAAQGYKN